MTCIECSISNLSTWLMSCHVINSYSVEKSEKMLVEIVKREKGKNNWGAFSFQDENYYEIYHCLSD